MEESWLGYLDYPPKSDVFQLTVSHNHCLFDKFPRILARLNWFVLKQRSAVRVSDLQELLLRHQPDIVHFSGHGSKLNEIILEDDSGKSHPVSSSVLDQLFSLLGDNIRCVVLNACYSDHQAQTIAEHIDCVVGMSKVIGDQSSIRFAAAFYRALGYGKDVKTSFDLGCLQINLENLGEQDVPRLLALRRDPSDVVFVDSG